MLRVKLSLFLFVLFFLVIFPTTIFAHVLKTDSSVGAVIHIDPEDDPVAGETSNIYFEFKDKEGKFKANECECRFIVKKDGLEIFNTALFGANEEPNLSSSAISFTFPERNIYQVQVIGTPKNTGAFNSFTLSYDIRVERESERLVEAPSGGVSAKKENSFFVDHIIHFVVGGVGIFAVVIVLFYSRKKGIKH